MRIVIQGGDNMLGRAIQLTLPYQSPNDSIITDSQSAQQYLTDINLPLPLDYIRQLNIDGSYLWGNIPLNLQEDIRIINLEAAPTFSVDTSSPKSIHYHVNINNIPGLFSRFTSPYVLCLANNHSMDMGYNTFVNETLPYLSNAIGIGINKIQAYTPKIINKIAIFAFGAGCSGVPIEWSATDNRAGIAYLPPLISEENVITAFNIIKDATHNYNNYYKILSIHWGPNFSSYNDGQYYRKLLAHRLVDELNIGMIHGHSSHHIRGIELYKNRLILYGAGDFINDYENIPSSYSKIGAMYIIDVDDNSYTTHAININFVSMNKLACHLIPVSQEIKEFINTESRHDADYPLII